MLVAPRVSLALGRGSLSASTERRDPITMSDLHRGARLGKYEEVAASLARGENLDAMSVHHFSPLMLAAREGHLPVVLFLLEGGANVHLTHPNGRTALHLAASNGHLAVVEALVKRGANVGALSSVGSTPALEAAQFNHGSIVEFLKSQGTDSNLRDRQGLTANDWLAQGGMQGRFEPLLERLRHSPAARDRAEQSVRKLMATGLSADEFAAKRGRNILVWSYGAYEFADPEVMSWARRVAEILCNADILEQCEERFLTGEELSVARQVRARRERANSRRDPHAAKTTA